MPVPVPVTWKRRRRSESERMMSPQAKQGFNASGWISSFRDVHDISKATLLLGERKSPSHCQRQNQRQYQYLWQRRRRSESEWTPSLQSKQRFVPSGWISSFQAVCNISKATLLLGEFKSLSHRKKQRQRQHQSSWNRRRRSESERTTSPRAKRGFIISGWLSPF